jgi:POT family proton-dependent oligopeptide transporter
MNQGQITEANFFGHPIGLRTLFLTEMWERMSFYGMRALLVLYMTGAVTGFNGGLGFSQVDAQAIYGIYVGMVYFMVVPGGWLADNLLGHQKAVLYGGVVITIGHFTLALPLQQTFFLGLALVVLGTGLLKGNISTIVGELYSGRDDQRDSGFTLFYMSINIGSFLGFLVCGYLGEKVGWHWGFGAAGIGMLLGLIQYVRYRSLLGEAGAEPNAMPEFRRKALSKYSIMVGSAMLLLLLGALLGWVEIEARAFAENFAYFLTVLSGGYFLYLYLFAGLSDEEKRNVLVLFFLFIAAAAFWSGFDQSGGSLNIFARDYTDLAIGGFEMPVSWVQFFNPIFVVIFAPLFAAFWTYLARRNLDPSLPVKFVIGLLLMALSFVVMLFAVGLALEQELVSVRWLLLTYLLHTWGELALSPIGLSAFSRYSPKKYVGQMFGLWFLASAIGGVLAGILGGEALDSGLETISPVFSFMIKYYLVIAAVMLIIAYLMRQREPNQRH